MFSNILVLRQFPDDATKREVSHIFRCYDGFVGMVMNDKQSPHEAYAVYLTEEAAIEAHDNLQGYLFNPSDDQPVSISFITDEAHGNEIINELTPSLRISK